MRILYSFGKSGYEAECWEREITASSTPDLTFIPFNHGSYLRWQDTQDAVQLDRLYQAGDQRLMALQASLEGALEEARADVLMVTNAPPYHPDFLRRLSAYKVLYSTDDPGATYQRTIPYIHAYDHVMYCAPGYSADMSLGGKLSYAGARRADWLPLGVFDFEMNVVSDLAVPVVRDIDIVYVGGCYLQKLPLLAAIRRVFGSRVTIKGRFHFKQNAYLVLRHGYLGWVSPVSFEERVRLYQRAKIGFNVHWNEHGLGNQRLFHLPANGVMQICDCPELVADVFEVGREIEAYSGIDDLLDKLRFYLENDGHRQTIAAAGQARVLREYRIAQVNARAAALITNVM